ncbi:ATP-binding protein [Trueperella bernardiae]|uniref:ATP-binding protein n=1 Tax=Trueperella bernardiae TaxID=59561 RepID=A0AAW6ZCJ6_9ACTO|nr:RNA-binding domain-containing protein [Trueperella bernardiae]MDK8600955.1 ATP-binding protein [Trueperella bernardiae]
MKWTTERLLRTLEEFRQIKRDATDVEVKRASKLPCNLPETMCAFANMPGGGAVILGVDERDNFAVVGVDNAHELAARVVDQTRSSVTPAPQLLPTVLTWEGREVLVVEVTPLPLSQRPALHRGRAYLRQSDGDYVMNDADRALIEIQKLGQSELYRFDSAAVSSTSIDDLDPNAAADFCANARKTSRRLAQVTDDAELLELTNVLAPGGEVTLAGLYSLGRYPQAKAPQLRVTASVQLPRDRSGSVRTRSRQDFDGPLPDLLNSALRWVEENAPRHNRYLDDGNMVEEPLFPLVAVREIIANALVHRDLSPNSEGQWVEVRIVGDHLIVTNPGGLRGISKEQLASASLAKNAVNPRLYDMAKRLRTDSGASVIEGEGGGVSEVYRQLGLAGLPAATFADNGVRFTAILYGTPVAYAELPTTMPAPTILDVEAEQDRPERPVSVPVLTAFVTKNGEAVLEALAASGPLSFQELRARTGLNTGRLRYALNKLKEAGSVGQYGGWGNRDTKYHIVSE